jgi:FlgD Ig-like domain
VSGGGPPPKFHETRDNLFAPASPWVQISNVADYEVTATDFFYLLATPTLATLCRRSLATFTASPTCIDVSSGDFTSGWSLTLASVGSSTLVHIQDYVGTVEIAYVVSWPLMALSPLELPTGSTLGGAVPGGSPYVVVLDADSVPTVRGVTSYGATAPSFAIPATRTVRPIALAVAPDRVDGGDSRDGSPSVQVWSRAVSASGFGTETTLPARASGISASAGRTAVLGRAGVSVFDRGALQHTFADAASTYLVGISGPYVVEGQVDASNNPSTKVSKADGSLVQTFSGWPVGVFGSQYLTGSVDALPTGSLHLVVHDLTGTAANVSYALPAGTAECYPTDVWGATIAVACDTGTWAGTSRVYNYKTGALLGSTTGTAEGLGDGYAVVNNGPTDSLWAIAANTLTPSVCNSNYLSSDGVGHVVCASATDLIWQDYSSLSTQAPRLLGTLAAATAGFSEPGSTWSLALDTTKALAAGSVVISNSLGVLVRSLATTAVTSADGSVRVTWDGLDGTGKPVPAGTYTYKLVANAVDGTGAVVSIGGTAGLSDGTLTVTAASTLGMAIGGFATLPPSRLLDTRITGPKLGAGQTRSLQVTGVGGVPSTNVAAVVLNVTVTETSSGGYLTVSPTGTTRPTVSNLNWSAGATIPNAVTVKVGSNGMVDLFQSGPGTAQVIVDVAGYYLGGTPVAAGGFTSITPARILDTRSTGGAFTAGETRDLTILGAGTVPASNVSAVVLNVTVTETSNGGYLTVFPSGTTRPLASNLNWSAGLTIPNLTTVKVGANGKVSLFQSGPGTAQVIVDVAGYYTGGTPTLPGTFVALTPTRVLDTRPTPVPANGDLTLTILGKGTIPTTGVSAVVINTTVAETKAPGYLTVYPGTNPLPTASNLNWSGANTTIPNLVTVQVGSDSSIKFHNGSSGTTQIIADTAGYYIGD